MGNFHFEILDEKRKKLLPLLKQFKDRFYLAGGTGLALQFGHRDSIDFDFFTDREFNSEELLREVKEVFVGLPVKVAQAGNMTLNLVVADAVSVSFFCIRDKVIRPFLDAEYFNLVSVDDIACMKIAALLRASFKDYVDLYFILKTKSLKEIFADCKKKYDNFDEMVYLKALGSFDDINMMEIMFKGGNRVTIDEIRKDFNHKIKKYIGSNRI